MSNFSSIGVSRCEIIRDPVSPAPLPPARRSRVQTDVMAAAEKARTEKAAQTTRKQVGRRATPQQVGKPAEQQEDLLPPNLAAALTAFERHLRAERSLSPHTVRAYLGDVTSLLDHAHQAGVQAPADLQAT